MYQSTRTALRTWPMARSQDTRSKRSVASLDSSDRVAGANGGGKPGGIVVGWVQPFGADLSDVGEQILRIASVHTAGGSGNRRELVRCGRLLRLVVGIAGDWRTGLRRGRAVWLRARGARTGASPGSAEAEPAPSTGAGTITAAPNSNMHFDNPLIGSTNPFVFNDIPCPSMCIHGMNERSPVTPAPQSHRSSIDSRRGNN